MPITAKQTKNANWDFDVVQERLLRASGGKAPIYANVRTDTDEVLGYSTDRYGIVQNDDLLGRAESAFNSRGISYERNVYATDNGARCEPCTTSRATSSKPRFPKWATSWATA